MIGLRSLAGLCRRLAIATRAGIDDRTIWAREADQGPAVMRRQLGRIRDAVAAGESVDIALAETGSYFPILFREMIAIGQHTGRMGDILHRLASHYEQQIRLRRTFLAAITWPVLQLVAAVVVIGLFIWIIGVLGSADLLGFGLVGTSGLLRYGLFIGTIGCGAVLLAAAFRRGVFWIRPIQRALLKVPGVGGCLRTIALFRLTWTLHLTLNVEMDLRRSLPIALRSTGNDLYIAQTDRVVADITAGREIHEALRRTGVFPEDFLHMVEVAERSGRLVESMGHMSSQYEEQARAATATLAVVAGFAVWALVASLIIVLIFRLFSAYVGAIMDAAGS